jgi:hypothetical protein
MKDDRGWMEVYWAGKRGAASTPHWSRARHHLATIRQSGLGGRRQVALLWFLLRTLNWQRAHYSRETLGVILSRVPLLRSK